MHFCSIAFKVLVCKHNGKRAYSLSRCILEEQRSNRSSFAPLNNIARQPSSLPSLSLVTSSTLFFPRTSRAVLFKMPSLSCNRLPAIQRTPTWACYHQMQPSTASRKKLTITPTPAYSTQATTAPKQDFIHSLSPTPEIGLTLFRPRLST